MLSAKLHCRLAAAQPHWLRMHAGQEGQRRARSSNALRQHGHLPAAVSIMVKQQAIPLSALAHHPVERRPRMSQSRVLGQSTPRSSLWVLDGMASLCFISGPWQVFSCIVRQLCSPAAEAGACALLFVKPLKE